MHGLAQSLMVLPRPMVVSTSKKGLDENLADEEMVIL